MTQYDAGPGDRSDREWEAPERKPVPHARRRGPTLPPWALLAIVVGVLVLLCLAVVFGLRAIRDRARERPTPQATVTSRVLPVPTWTPAPGQTGPTTTPSATVVLPIGPTATGQVFTEIAPGATVVVQGTGGQGLNLRAEPSAAAALVVNLRDGALLTVLEGPKEAGGYIWWKLQTADNKQGWGAANWLVLQTTP